MPSEKIATSPPIPLALRPSRGPLGRGGKGNGGNPTIRADSIDAKNGIDTNPSRGPKPSNPESVTSRARRLFRNRCNKLYKIHPDDKERLDIAWARYVAYSVAALETQSAPDGTPLSVQDACAVANIVGKALGKFAPEQAPALQRFVIAFDRLGGRVEGEARAMLSMERAEAPISVVETTAVPVPAPLGSLVVDGEREGVSQVDPPPETRS